MKLLGCIIIYEPELDDLKKNAESLVHDVDKLIFWKNSIIDNKLLITLVDEDLKENIIILGTGENLGISGALNQVVEIFQNEDYSHLLTMDQDSNFKKGHLSDYIKKVEEYEIKNIGVYGINPKTHNGLLFEESQYPIKANEIITSGSIFPLDVLKSTGGFKKELFIDAVDYEYCFRIKDQYNLDTLIFPDVILNHKIGYPRKTSFGFRVDEYSAFRTYYIVRNQIYVWKRYPHLFERKYKINLLRNHIILRFFKILLAENDKYNKIKSISKGIKDGLFNLT